MGVAIIVGCSIVGLVAITYMITRKNVRKHITEISFGKFFQFKTETEFNK